MAAAPREKQRRRDLAGLIASGAIVLLAPFVGAAVTALFLRSAFGDSATADPSQKARVLAQGISEAMNGALVGIVVSVVALIPTAIFAARIVRARRGDVENRPGAL